MAVVEIDPVEVLVEIELVDVLTETVSVGEIVFEVDWVDVLVVDEIGPV